MVVPPLVVVAYPNILHQTLGRIELLHRNSKCQDTVWRIYHATCTISLLHVVVVLLNKNPVVAIQFCKILHRRQIGRTQIYIHILNVFI